MKSTLYRNKKTKLEGKMRYLQPKEIDQISSTAKEYCKGTNLMILGMSEAL